MAVLIIAEAGVNHNGSLELAKKMADVAKEAGADIVKYQTAVPELVISTFAEKADYQKAQTGEEESQLDMVRKIHFDFAGHKELKEYCDEIGIMYLSTPFDLDSIDFLESIDMPVYKIPSGEITNLPYLEKIAKIGKPVILSTGMSTIEEIGNALGVLNANSTPQVTVLHCNTEYPTPMHDANVRAMLDIFRNFGVPVGFSDHTLGMAAPLAAVALGAVVVEKHFTLDKNMDGPDHKASMSPEELKELIKTIRETELALGDGQKKVTESEAKNINIARKSIVAIKPIKKGDLLTEENLYVKRPGGGISPMKWHEVLGTQAVRDFAPDELIEV
jgi:N-acetylneuraminate synthase